MKTRFRTPSLIFYGISGLVLLISIISFTKAISWIDKPFPGFLLYKFPRVGSMGSTDWPGIKAGLRLMDKIVAVNEKPIRQGQDVVDIAREKSLGTLVHYTVESGEQIRKVGVPITKFGTVDFLIVFFLPFLGGLARLSIGFIAYILKPNVSTSWAFFFFCLVVSIYMVTGFEMQSTYLFVQLHYFVIPFQGAILFHLGSIFPEKKRFTLRHPIFEYGVYLPALILAVLFELELFTFMRTSSAHPLSWIPNIKTITAFARIFILSGVVGFIILVLHSMFRTSSNVVRQRAKMIFFGVTLAFFPTVLVFLLVHFMKIRFPFNFMIFFVLFFPASMAYAIVRHNLFDADAIIRRTVGYVVVTAVVVGAYVGVSVLVNVFLGKYEIAQSSAFPIIFTLAIILIFNPLRNRIQLLVDKIFFRKEYDFGQIVNRIGDTITSSLDLGHILKQIMRTFADDMFIDTSSVMLLNPAKTGYQVYLADGERKEEVEQVLLSQNQPLSQVIVKEKKEVTKYDVLEDPKYKAISEDCSRGFESLRASLIVPLVFQNEVTGLISLGEKKSGKFYNREDINFLHTLARQGAVAIENARLFQENIEKSRMEEELKIAHNLQTSMLPDKAPTIEGFSIVARSIPAREVGGDFYDFIEIIENGAKRLGIVVGDVSGKAVSGALVMAASRSIFRVLTETNESVEAVMNRANARLQRDVKKGMFVALLYAVLNPAEKTLTLSNAGQIQPILCSPEKPKPEYVNTEGDKFPLGIVKDCHYEETKVSLKQGDVLVFSTDGIVEAVNDKGELYGFERFLASIEEGQGLSADELLEKIIKDVMFYVGKVEQHDDLTAVVVRVE
jgi:serine phosphatase RsbU (regulator of sigma subunit)